MGVGDGLGVGVGVGNGVGVLVGTGVILALGSTVGRCVGDGLVAVVGVVQDVNNKHSVRTRMMLLLFMICLPFQLDDFACFHVEGNTVEGV